MTSKRILSSPSVADGFVYITDKDTNTIRKYPGIAWHYASSGELYILTPDGDKFISINNLVPIIQPISNVHSGNQSSSSVSKDAKQADEKKVGETTAQLLRAVGHSSETGNAKRDDLITGDVLIPTSINVEGDFCQKALESVEVNGSVTADNITQVAIKLDGVDPNIASQGSEMLKRLGF